MSRVERVYLSARAHVRIRHQGLVAKTAMDWTQRLNPVTRRSAHYCVRTMTPDVLSLPPASVMSTIHKADSCVQKAVVVVTLMEVGAPGDIGLNAAPPVVI